MPNAAHSLLLILSSHLRASNAGACLATYSSTATSSAQTHIYAGVPTRCLPHVFHQLRHFIPYHCVLHMCAPRRKQPCGGSDKMRNGRHFSEPGPGCTPRYTPRQHPWCIPPHSTPPSPIYLTSPYLSLSRPSITILVTMHPPFHTPLVALPPDVTDLSSLD